MSTKIKLRRDTLANWQSYNPVLADGELALVRDSGKIKVGDGTSRFNDLEYTYYNLTELNTLLSGKSDVGHNHDDRYYTESEVDIKLEGKSNIDHNHNSIYYTKTECNDFLSGKSDVGHNHDDRYYTESEVDNIMDTKLDKSEKGVAGGLATLDTEGKVPIANLPSYVDDVLEYDTVSDFPSTGESGKIYVSKDDNKTYRWTGSQYIEISSSLALGETSSTAFRGDLGKVAYDHSQQTSGNPHNVSKSDVGLGNVDNTSDMDKPISNAVQQALNGKSNIDHTHDDRYYTESEINNLLLSKINVSDKGIANGVAPLDENGKVPAANLPSYVDDVLEYNSISDFPTNGESGKIYVAKDTGKSYRWTGSAYILVAGGYDKHIDIGEMSPDDTLVGVDNGVAFGNIPTIDFDPSQDGAIYFNFMNNNDFNTIETISLKLIYILNGTSSGKNVLLNLNINEMLIGSTSESLIYDSNKTLSDSNAGKLESTTFTFNISNISSLIIFKLTRLASDSSDTFEGELKLVKAIISQ